MPFVRRDSTGAIAGASDRPQPDGGMTEQVPDTDPGYIAFRTGQTPTLLATYAQKAQAAVLQAGRTFNVAASGQPAVEVLCDGTNPTRADLALLALFGQVNPTESKPWLANDGTVTPLTGAEYVTLATLAGNWTSATYATLAQLLGEIEATPPAITTQAQIDAAYAAIPSA